MGPEAGIELVHGREWVRAPREARDDIRRRIEVTERLRGSGMGLIASCHRTGRNPHIASSSQALDRARRNQLSGFKHRIDPYLELDTPGLDSDWRSSRFRTSIRRVSGTQMTWPGTL